LKSTIRRLKKTKKQDEKNGFQNSEKNKGPGGKNTKKNGFIIGTKFWTTLETFLAV